MRASAYCTRRNFRPEEAKEEEDTVAAVTAAARCRRYIYEQFRHKCRDASQFSPAGHARDAIRIHRRVISPRDILMPALVKIAKQRDALSPGCIIAAEKVRSFLRSQDRFSEEWE